MKPVSTKAEEALETAGINFRDRAEGRGVRIINNVFRSDDDSHLWPICGHFSATERAIKKLRGDYRPDSLLEYIYALEAEISRIVNNY